MGTKLVTKIDINKHVNRYEDMCRVTSDILYDVLYYSVL